MNRPKPLSSISNPPSFLRALIFFCTFIFLLSALCLGFELLLRGIYSAHLGQSQFMETWYRAADFTGWHAPRAGVINRLGFHNVELRLPKSPDTFRVIVMGGSVVYGEDPIESSWVWKFEQVLKKKLPNRHVEVLNAGIPGGTTQEDLSVLRKIIFLDPDLIIEYSGWNEVYCSHYVPQGYRNRDPAYGLKGDLKEFRGTLFKKSFSLALLNASLKKMRDRSTVNTGRSQAVPPKDSAAPAPSKISEPSPTSKTKKILFVWDRPYEYELNSERAIRDSFSQVYEKNLKLMSRIAARHRVPFVSILQPNLAYSCAAKNIPGDTCEKILKPATGILYEDWLQASKVLYPIAQGVQKQLVREGMQAVDFSDIFEGREADSFSDSVHQPLTGDSQNRLAEQTAAVLTAQHLLPN